VSGFAGGLEMGIAVLVLYLVLQNLEGYVLTPLLATIFGVYGLILAAPLAVVGMVAVKLLYVEDVLGDKTSG
jgi:predicted PurR-regulated permease PerM